MLALMSFFGKLNSFNVLNRLVGITIIIINNKNKS